MGRLIYSFDNGELWTPHNHARVFKNDSYIVLAQDKIGENSEPYEVVVDNYKKRRYDYPNIWIDSATPGFISDRWFNSPVRINFATLPSDGFNQKYYEALSHSGPWSEIAGTTILVNPSVKQTRYYKIVDQFNNESPVRPINIMLDSDSPTNLNVAILTKAGYLHATLTATDALSGIAGYSLSLNNGDTWTPIQRGGFFEYRSLASGTYLVKGRAYDLAGNFVESTAQSHTI